jgi:hypothetical protein
MSIFIVILRSKATKDLDSLRKILCYAQDDGK